MPAAGKPKPTPKKAPAILSLKEQKAALRKQFLHRRMVIPEDLKNTTRWKVINHLRTLISDIAPSVIAIYYPMNDEIDLLSLAAELWRDNQIVALPRVNTRNHLLVFNVWPPHGPLGQDALGIPAANGAEIHPALIVVPMLGYSRSGQRLGSGAGYYDRTLASLAVPALTVGVCYTELELKDFPEEKHDTPLDYIVTGKEVIVCT